MGDVFGVRGAGASMLAVGSDRRRSDLTASGVTRSACLVRWAGRLALWVLVLVLAATALTASAWAASTGSISGTVTDAAGHPITSGDICVEVYAVDSADSADATTNSTGGYTATGLAAGTYNASAYDCPTSSRNDLGGYYDGGANGNPQAVAVASGASVTGINIQLAAATSISGMVYTGSGTGSPAGNVCVTVSPTGGQGGSGSATSAADGTYSVKHLSPGASYSVEFDPSCSSGSQYAPQWYSGSETASGAGTVTPTVASPATGIDAHLVVGGSVTGTITDASGKAITSQDVCVNAESSDGSSSGQATTNASGVYTIGGLLSGSYSVEADDCAGSSRNDFQTSYSGGSVSVTLGQVKSGINIQMTAATSISGTVYGGSGTTTKVTGICVDAEPTGNAGVYGEATSTANGSYTITQLTPGADYSVEFDPSCSSGSQYAPQWYSGSETASGAGTVTPTVASPATGIDAHLVVGGSVTGTITDASGKAITSQDVCVNAESSDGSSSGQATTNASGVYTIGGLLSGSYSVEADDCAGSSRNDFQTSYSGGSVSVTLGQVKSGINIQMTAATSISGTVYGGSGTTTPLADACVALYDTNGDQLERVDTTSSGTYTFKQLTPGTGYLIEFDPCENSDYVTGYYANQTTLANATTVTPTATPATGIDGHLSLGATISGTITNASGTAITSGDICVEADPNGSSGSYGQTTSNSSGGYSLVGLAAGSYDVEAYDCNGSSRNDAPTYYGSPTAVTVTLGQTAGAINIQMNAATSISGTVYGGTGTTTRLSGACVSVDDASGDELGYANTASDGTYTVDQLTPGTAYAVQFQPCGSQSNYLPQYYNEQPTLADANLVTPTLAAPATGIDGHLQATASISGTLTDASGKAITTQDVCVDSSNTSDGSDGNGSVTIDASGNYELTGLTPGSYDVFARDCGDQKRNDLQTYYTTGASGSKTAVAVSAGEVKTGINISMLPATSISGTVYGGTGTSTPLSAVCVTAYTASTGDEASSTSTATDGTYTITGLTPGTGYQVGFDPCSSSASYSSQYYDNEGSLANADVIVPTAANPSTGIDAHLSASASISGTVRDAAGNPITTQDICVDVDDGDTGGYGGSATTDASGNYTVTGLSAGSYYVGFSDCDGSSRNDVVQYYGGASQEDNSTLVVLSSGGQQTGVNAQLAAGTSIAGRVYGGSGTSNPLSEACVEVDDSNGDYYYSGRTNAQGNYTIGHIAPGESYTVDFSQCASANTYVSAYYGGTYDESTAVSISPTVAAPATGISANLPVGATISGTVKDTSGNPVTSGVCADAELNSDSASYGAETTGLNSTGGYTISGLPTGSYDIEFYDCDGSRNDLETYTTANATQPNATTGVNVTMQPATSISGTVYGGSGTSNPLDGVCVDAQTSDGAYYGDAETDANGQYVIDHLTPGQGYVVEFSSCSNSTAQYATQYYDGVSSISQAAVLTPTLALPSVGVNGNLPSGAPITTITGGPAANAQTSQTDNRFAFTADVAGATFRCSVDGGTLQACTSPYDTGTLAAGQHSFTVEASANGYAENNPPSVSWTINPSSMTSTSQGEVTSGGTFSSDPGGTTSASTPVIVTVTPPSASQVTLTTEPTTTTAPNGYMILGQQVDISAAGPDGSGTVTGTTSNPIELTFTLAASQVPAGTSPGSVTLTRNGTAAADCSAHDGTASPDPCVESRTTDSSGDITITVLTTHCSTWNFAAPNSTGTTTTTTTTTTATTPTGTTPTGATPTGTTPTGTTSTTTTPINTPSGGSKATSPTAQQINAALRRVLAPTGPLSKIAALLKHRSYSFAFNAPGAGKLVIDWYYLPPGATLPRTAPAAFKHKPLAVLIGSVVISVSKAQATTAVLKLTPAGRSRLKSANKLKLTAVVSFTPTQQTATTSSASFTLKR